jgi:hypothetical protein
VTRPGNVQFQPGGALKQVAPTPDRSCITYGRPNLLLLRAFVQFCDPPGCHLFYVRACRHVGCACLLCWRAGVAQMLANMRARSLPRSLHSRHVTAMSSVIILMYGYPPHSTYENGVYGSDLELTI